MAIKTRFNLFATSICNWQLRKWQIYLPFIFKNIYIFLIYIKMEHIWSVSMAYINSKNIFFENHNNKIAKNRFCLWVISLLSKISFYQFSDKISYTQKKKNMFWKANATWSIFCIYSYIKKRKTKKLSPLEILEIMYTGALLVIYIIWQKQKWRRQLSNTSFWRSHKDKQKWKWNIFRQVDILPAKRENGNPDMETGTYHLTIKWGNCTSYTSLPGMCRGGRLVLN